MKIVTECCIVSVGFKRGLYCVLNFLVASKHQQDWKLDKRSSDVYVTDDSSNKSPNATNTVSNNSMESSVDEEAPLLASSRLSYIGRSKPTQ